MALARLKGDLVDWQEAKRICKDEFVRKYLEDQIDEIDEEIILLELQRGIGIKKREENVMDKKQEQKQCKMIGWIMTIVAIILLALVAINSGCQTVRGMAHDVGSVTDYVQDQIPKTDTRDQYQVQ